MDRAREWVNWDPNPQTRSEIQALIDQDAQAELTELLSQRLKFGTAGLRGQMGAGYGRMNDLVVLQTAQVIAVTQQLVSCLMVDVFCFVDQPGRVCAVIWKRKYPMPNLEAL